MRKLFTAERFSIKNIVFKKNERRERDDYYPSERAKYNDDSRNNGYNSYYNNREEDFIPKKVERNEVFLGAKKLKKVSQTSTKPSPAIKINNEGGQLQEGCIIKHERFGIGKISQISGDGENKKAVVSFENVGVKQLLLKFAKFEIIG